MSSYRELDPARALHPFVACRWERRVAPDVEEPEALVLPDGCVDLLWRGGRVVIAGPDRAAKPTPTRPSETILGLRLRPGVANAVLGIPSSELLDQRVSLADVMGSDAERITERLAASSGRNRPFELLESVVASRLVRGDGPDPAVLAATRRLGFRGSRVSQLAEALGLSERQLRRRFADSVGYGPKMLDRVLRFRRFVAQSDAISAGEEDLARTAADVGYADQAHLSRDCQRLAGMSPTDLVAIWAR